MNIVNFSPPYLISSIRRKIISYSAQNIQHIIEYFNIRLGCTLIAVLNLKPDHINYINSYFSNAMIYGIIMACIAYDNDNKRLLMTMKEIRNIIPIDEFINLGEVRDIFCYPLKFVREFDYPGNSFVLEFYNYILATPPDFSLVNLQSSPVSDPETPSETKKKLLSKLANKLNRDKKEENGDYACLICLENRKIVILLPCSHQVYCVGCSIEQFVDKLECPVCRVKAIDILVTF